MSRLVERVAILASGLGLGAGGFYLYETSKRKQQAGSSNLPAVVQPSAPAPAKGDQDLARRTAQSVLQFGFPGPVVDMQYRQAFVSSYDRRLRNANWVAEHLTAEALIKRNNVDRVKSMFAEDSQIPDMFRARLVDYARSGFDRGHLVPAADARISQDAMNETFFLTNISPQVGEGFNRGYWSYFETWVRGLTKSFKDVYVFTGPLYLPKKESDGNYYVRYQVIGNPPNVAVPTHFYKVILGVLPSGEQAIGAFLLPNEPIAESKPLESFAVPVDAIERSAGVRFFDRLDRSKTLPLCSSVKCVMIPDKYWKSSGGGSNTKQAVGANADDQ